MPERERLLSLLESFVDSSVKIKVLGVGAEALVRKLATLQRVVERLRLRTGRVETRVRMDELLASSIDVAAWDSGAVLRVVPSRYPPHEPTMDAPEERGQVELQVPLIEHLLQTHQQPQRINDLLVDFVESIKGHLSPADVETTRTGVTRVVTTTRGAAQALRDHGLLIYSDRTAYKTWELSVLGLLVAAILREGNAGGQLQARRLRTRDGGAFGASNTLAEPLRHALDDLANADVVVNRLRTVFGANHDVFASFERAVELITQFCERLQGQAQAGQNEWHTKRATTRAFLDELRLALAPRQLADDLLKNYALKGLLGQ
jgi:hypothetical protein